MSLPPGFKQFRREFDYTWDQGVEMMGTPFRFFTKNTETVGYLKLKFHFPRYVSDPH